MLLNSSQTYYTEPETMTMRTPHGPVLLLMTKLAPLVVMSAFSVLIVREVRRSGRGIAANVDAKREREIRVTKMLLLVIGVFVFCQV